MVMLLNVAEFIDSLDEAIWGNLCHHRDEIIILRKRDA
jgi:hypothetical protein